MKFKRYLTEALGGMGTKIAESSETMLAASLAVRQMLGRDINIEDLNNSNLEKSEKFMDIDGDPYYELKWADNVLLKSSVFLANLFGKSGYLKKSNYIFHKYSSLTFSIYGSAKRLGFKGNPNKWNPADIWASKINTIPDFDSLDDLNNFIAKKLESGDLIGISTKKSKGKGKVKLQGDKPVIVKFKDILKPPGPFSNNNAVIKTSNFKMKIRTFSSAKKGVMGEVEGIEAQKGKVGAGKISSALKEFAGEDYIKWQRVEKMDDIEKFETVKKLYDRVGIKWNWNKVELPKNYNWNSKIQALSIADIIKNSRQRDQIVDKIYNYARGRSSESSQHIEVG